MSEDKNVQPPEQQFTVYQEAGWTTKLAHPPTQELLDLNQIVPGIFRHRGTVCSYFPQNLICNIFTQEYWNTVVKNSGYPSAETEELLPPLYKYALTVLPEVRLLAYRKQEQAYEPVIGPSGEQLRLRNVLFRQGYGAPLGIALDPPYGGLILSVPDTMPLSFTGHSPENLDQLVVERIMNDGPLNDRSRRGYHVNAGRIPPIVTDHSFEIFMHLMESTAKADRYVDYAYRDFIEKQEQMGNTLHTVPYLPELCSRLGISYNPADVNYRLADA